MMRKSYIKLVLLLLPIMATIASCNRGQKFDRVKWQYGNGIDFPLRDQMLEDLMATQKIKGLNYYQAKQLLGAPQDTGKLKLSYEIINTGHQYNPKNKPIYKKYFMLYFGKDSTVVKTEVYEHTDKDMRKKD